MAFTDKCGPPRPRWNEPTKEEMQTVALMRGFLVRVVVYGLTTFNPTLLPFVGPATKFLSEQKKLGRL